jgi:hypothetical protein
MAPHHALTVEEIINGCPNPVLPKIDHDPTFDDTQVATRLLNANTILVPSMAGGGAHGYLGIILTQVEYAVISGTPSTEPHNPGPTPLSASGTNPVDAAQLARLRDEFRRIHTCPMHLVNVKVKVDSYMLIKIIVSIKVILVLVEGFSLLQNLNIKLPSTYVLRRKEVKRVPYFVPALTEVYLPLVLKLQ